MTNAERIMSIILATSLTCFAGCKKDQTNVQDMQKGHEQMVVVANKAAGSISFIDAKHDELVKTLPIPGSEPMYVVYVQRNDKLYIGDRQQKKVHIVDPATKVVEQSIAVGNGVFHMWADAMGKSLWVVNDADQTISVIDLTSNMVVKTIQVGIKPHDVFLSDDGAKAYVSVFTNDGSVADSVFLYNTTNYQKIVAKGVGKEPHLFAEGNKLFVACQSGTLYTLDADLNVLTTLPLSGAHGIFKARATDFIYVSDITGNQLYTVKQGNNTLLKTLSETPATPHNITVSDDGRKMYVTHSGNTATSVVAYELDPISGAMMKKKTITTAANPFGLTYYSR